MQSCGATACAEEELEHKSQAMMQAEVDAALWRLRQAELCGYVTEECPRNGVRMGGLERQDRESRMRVRVRVRWTL